MGTKYTLINEKINSCINGYNNISLDAMESMNELEFPFMFTKNELEERYTNLINEYRNLKKEDIYYSNKIIAIDKAHACLLECNQEV
ncbi:hypothetical protein DRP43_04925 [candidate division TA06 bacterium]|uniref:Uncharacterized protein n=1 Tax=candidate division TA06 bacterium TaxID=2250710 RepID=A0A660SFK8_UNCT6|nr:MAG: hypothetical protein DRP43_04925 [candidate division TA06 bacterium]